MIKFGNTAYLFIILAIVKMSLAQGINNNLFSTRLSRIELETNTGLVWLVQVKGNVNINDNVYGKFRVSESFLISDLGFIVGYQRASSIKNRMQIGIGFSKGMVVPFVPSGPDVDDTTEHWNGLIIDSNFIHYFNEGILRIGFNVGFNFIIAKKRAIPSLNLGLIVGAF